MKRIEEFKKGINLGGWLSQCSHTKKHYESFITEKDLEKIASWNLDHVRLPFDYNLLQDDDGEIIEENSCWIDRCVSWCKKHNLHLVLALHKTKGYSNDGDENESNFFYDEELIARFIILWQEIAKRYGNEPSVTFELLTETGDKKDNEKWINIARKTIAVFRHYAPKTKILLGGNYDESILSINELSDPFDKNIIYSFNCFEPMLFTHQGAAWKKGMNENFRISYPLTKEEFIKGWNTGTSNSKAFCPKIELEDKKIDCSYFENLFKEAIKVSEKRKTGLYCCEYGVINLADTESAINWLKDIHSVFEKHNISRALWNYKEKDFGLMDKKYDSVRDQIIQYL